MKTWSKWCAAGAGAAILAAGAPAAAEAAPTKLVGTVGPAFTITLTTATGKKVTTLQGKTYTIVVRDRSDDHNFRLRGPGLNRVLTGIDFIGTRAVKVSLRPGRYTFVCDPHADMMRGGFRVR